MKTFKSIQRNARSQVEHCLGTFDSRDAAQEKIIATLIVALRCGLSYETKSGPTSSGAFHTEWIVYRKTAEGRDDILSSFHIEERE